ncbi:MAG: transcription elongation factor GreA [Clostridia bacterium]|nr:transcription elongation factor GreA [Clostridia bacterium]
MNEYQMTHEALKELQDELDQLKTVGRAEMAEKIKVALSFGDLSENAEYDEAKSEQGKMESRINELEELIRNAVIVDDEAHEEGTVGRSSVVKIKNLDTKEEVTYRLVGFTQSDPLAGKISDESPVGKALIGKRVGDVIEVEAPRGKMSFKILEVAKKN